MPEAPNAAPTDSAGRDALTLVLGDDPEWKDADPKTLGSAVTVRCRVADGSVEVWTSITGLPPVFSCRCANRILLSSDLGLLGAEVGSLQLDPAAVMDLFQYGYPTGHRTLFHDTTLIPGGQRWRVRAGGEVRSDRVWSLPEATPRLDWPSYVAYQTDAFRTAFRQLDLTGSFFSLTAGLDTRTILAVLVSEGSVLPAATLTGPSLSLDARVAGVLSEAYAFPYHVVRLDGPFLRELPTYVVEASRRSGGVTSLEEAGEIYFYRQLAGLGSRRLSGGFGNQVARQGFERVSPRAADVAILAQDFLGAARRTAGAPPFAPGVLRWHALFERSLQEDGTLPSVGNASIGQSFATQQTPYASRSMIESLGRSPIGGDVVAAVSRSRARLRDLGHRLLGERRDRSFQRALISQVGGPVATYPVNWGWRPRGGVSPRGLVMGAAACLDQVASWSHPASRALSRGLRLVGAAGMQEIKPYRTWLTDWLKDFVHDTLLSPTTRQSGLFDRAALARLLHEHYVLGKSHCATVIAALDLALAYQGFCVGPIEDEAASAGTGAGVRLEPAGRRAPHAEG